MAASSLEPVFVLEALLLTLNVKFVSCSWMVTFESANELAAASCLIFEETFRQTVVVEITSEVKKNIKK